MNHPPSASAPPGSLADAPTNGSVLAEPLFRRFYAGQSIAVGANAIFLFCFPWFVLEYTGRPLIMGLLVAAAATPRALLMLFGGAVVDRTNPLVVLRLTLAIRAGLIGALSSAILTGWVSREFLFAFAFCYGLADAFFFPARASVVPRIVPRHLLVRANSALMATTQILSVVVPGAVGALLASPLWSAARSFGAAGPLLPLGGLFAATATLLLVALAVMGRANAGALTSTGPELASSRLSGLLQAVVTNLRLCWSDPAVRLVMLTLLAWHLFAQAVIESGLIVLARAAFQESSSAFGLIMGVLAAGTCLGVIFAARTQLETRARQLGAALALAIAWMGVMAALLTLLGSLIAVCFVVLLFGIASGGMSVLMVSWVQQRVEAGRLARANAVLMLCVHGIAPLAEIVAGALLEHDHRLAFRLSGGFLMALGVLVAVLQRRIDFSVCAPDSASRDDTTRRVRRSDDPTVHATDTTEPLSCTSRT